MDDEADLTDVDDTHNEWEYDSPEDTRSRTRQVLVGLANTALMILAGFMLGATIGYVLDAINKAHS